MGNKGLEIIVGDYELSGKEIIKEQIVPRLEEIKKADTFSIEEWKEPDSSQELREIISYMIENKEHFDNIKHFKSGYMVYEVAMLSQISQGDYSEFLKTFKNLKSIDLAGNSPFLGKELYHENLESIEVHTTGMNRITLQEITNAKLPSLKSLTLYFGSEESGNNCEDEDIKALLKSESVRNVESLGLVNSENEDEIVEILFKDGYIDEFKNLKELNLSYGVLTDNSGKVLLENSERVNRLEKIIIEYHGIIDGDIVDDLRDEYSHLVITDECTEYEECDEYEEDEEGYEEGKIEYWDLPMFTE